MIKQKKYQRLTKDILLNSNIIGQFDKKFIILKYKELFYIIVDQHALHERILLEKGCKNPCRLAVKFNDILELSFMKYLIKQIPLMKNPWVCAHGRPCFTILII